MCGGRYTNLLIQQLNELLAGDPLAVLASRVLFGCFHPTSAFSNPFLRSVYSGARKGPPH